MGFFKKNMQEQAKQNYKLELDSKCDKDTFHSAIVLLAELLATRRIDGDDELISIYVELVANNWPNDPVLNSFIFYAGAERYVVSKTYCDKFADNHSVTLHKLINIKQIEVF